MCWRVDGRVATRLSEDGELAGGWATDAGGRSGDSTKVSRQVRADGQLVAEMLKTLHRNVAIISGVAMAMNTYAAATGRWM